MESDRFDALTTRLSHLLTRRRSLGLLAASFAGSALVADTDARKKKKPCPPCKGRKKGKCKMVLPDGSPCAGGTCQAGTCGPAATCTDGIRNGNETGVDCGGSCPPCATGQTCTSRADCASALCAGGVCETCDLVSNPCGMNGAVPCVCTSLVLGSAPQCRQVTGNPPTCAGCPAGTTDCAPPPGVGSAICYKACGAP